MAVSTPGRTVRMRRVSRAVIRLCRMAMDFGQVMRITRHPDGVTPESDTTHTVMLGLVACAFAAEYLPRLDRGLIAQFALVHDLPEVYAGDIPTLRISDAGIARKERLEHAAWARINRELGKTLPWVPDMIRCYEARTCPEARYVKAIDKLMPKVTHSLNGGATWVDMNVTHEELVATYQKQEQTMLEYAADFPELFALRDELVRLALSTCPKDSDDCIQ